MSLVKSALNSAMTNQFAFDVLFLAWRNKNVIEYKNKWA